MSIDWIKYNNYALSALEKHNYYEAQNLFRHNAKINPCGETFHNLGIFYYEEGIETPRHRIMSGKYWGSYFLHKAESIFENHINLRALGDLCLEEKDYSNSIKYYLRAIKLSKSYAVLNNLGIAFYYSGDTSASVQNFEHSLALSSGDDRIKIAGSLAFIFYQKGETTHAIQILQRYLNQMDVDDQFIFSYLLGLFDYAYSLVIKGINFDPDIPTIAMLVDCAAKFNNPILADKIVQNKKDILMDSKYSSKKDISQLEQILLSEEYRKYWIGRYLYIPPMVRSCCYIGCPLHNSDLM